MSPTPIGFAAPIATVSGRRRVLDPDYRGICDRVTRMNRNGSPPAGGRGGLRFWQGTDWVGTSLAVLGARRLIGLSALGTAAVDRPLRMLFERLPLLFQGGRLAWLCRKRH